MELARGIEPPTCGLQTWAGRIRPYTGRFKPRKKQRTGRFITLMDWHALGSSGSRVVAGNAAYPDPLFEIVPAA